MMIFKPFMVFMGDDWEDFFHYMMILPFQCGWLFNVMMRLVNKGEVKKGLIFTQFNIINRTENSLF